MVHTSRAPTRSMARRRSESSAAVSPPRQPSRSRTERSRPSARTLNRIAALVSARAARAVDSRSLEKAESRDQPRQGGEQRLRGAPLVTADCADPLLPLEAHLPGARDRDRKARRAVETARRTATAQPDLEVARRRLRLVDVEPELAVVAAARADAQSLRQSRGIGTAHGPGSTVPRPLQNVSVLRSARARSARPASSRVSMAHSMLSR